MDNYSNPEKEENKFASIHSNQKLVKEEPIDFNPFQGQANHMIPGEQEDTHEIKILENMKNQKRLQLELLELQEMEIKLKKRKDKNRQSSKSHRAKGWSLKKPQVSGRSQKGRYIFESDLEYSSRNNVEEQKNLRESSRQRNPFRTGPISTVVDDDKDKSSFEYFDKEDLSDNSYGMILKQPQSMTNTNREHTMKATDEILQIQQDQQIEEKKQASLEPKGSPNLRLKAKLNDLSVDIKKKESKNIDDYVNHLSLANAPMHIQQSQTIEKQPNMVQEDINLIRDFVPMQNFDKYESISNQIQQQNTHLAIEPEETSRQYRSRGRSKKQKSKRKTKRSGAVETSQLPPTNSQQVLQDGERLPPPPQPQSYIKWLALQKGPTGADLFNQEEDEDGTKFFFEPLSFKKLMRVISLLHPINPETKTRFNGQDRITVKDYDSKITDCFFCYALTQKIKQGQKFIMKKFRKNKQNKFEKPESMIDLPDSGSSSSEGDEDKGLTKASQALGDGASLYLQMMKTLAIMFLLLSLVNIPLYIIYHENTSGNNLGNMHDFFKYFTIGNLGQLSKMCKFSNFNFKFDSNEEKPQNIKIDCGQGYIREIQKFGFLYSIDEVYGGPSDPKAVCDHIEHPMDTYEMPPIVVQPCIQEELEEKAYQICLIDQKLQRFEINEKEADEQKLPYLEVDPNEQSSKGPIVPVWSSETLEVEENPDTSSVINFENLDPICMYQNRKKDITQHLFKDKKATRMFTQYFENQCLGKQSCELVPEDIGKDQEIDLKNPNKEVDTGLFGLISEECKLRMSNEKYRISDTKPFLVTSTTYIGIFGCKYDTVTIPFSREPTHKEVVGVIIVCVDFFSILVMMFFFSKINAINNEFLESIDDLRVTMKDFGVQIDNVRLDKYSQDSRIVKMKVWLHFKDILEHCKDKFNDMQCIDVCLSLYTQPSIQCVFRMQEIQLDINRINGKLMTNQYKESEIPDKQEKLEELQQKQKRFELRYKALIQKKQKKDPESMSVQRIPKSQRIKQIQYIFVIFKNCETSDHVLDIYKNEQAVAKYIKKCLRKGPNNQTKPLFGRELNVVEALEPDEIIWQNLAYSEEEQRLRSTAIQIFSLFFLIANVLFTMYLKGFKTFMNRNIPQAVGCPDVVLSKEDTYKDFMKDFDDIPSTKSSGSMACYCKSETNIFLPWTIIGHNFQEFSDMNPQVGRDTTNYCFRWWGLQIIKQISLFFVSTSAVFINEYVAYLYGRLGKFQKKHTVIEEQITCFRQIFIQEYINMGIIILLTSFDQIGVSEILLGKYSDKTDVYNQFEPNWYMDYGNRICVFIFMSSFLINCKDVIQFILTALYRFYDRKFKFNMKLDPEDEDCDKPNSRIRIQSELETLYKGKMFKGEKAYSRMMSTMFVIQMYSSGMPILYLNGFVFYFVTYWVNKYLLIYYYQKSRTLTRTIPLFTMGYLKYGLLLHMIMACFMLTNNQAFITKTMFQGVSPVIPHHELDQKGLNNKSQFSKNLRGRFQFAHQQILFIFLICWIIFYFIGKTLMTIFTLLAQAMVSCFTNNLDNIIKKAEENFSFKMRQKRKMETHIKGNLLTKIHIQKEKILEERAKEEEEETKKQAEELAAQSDESSRNRVRAEIMIEELKEIEEQEKEQEAIRQVENSRRRGGISDINLNGLELISEEKKKEAERQLKLELRQKRLDRPDYSDNIIQELSPENLSNFYERSKKELEDFWDIFQQEQNIDPSITDPDSKNPYKVLFLETLYTYRIAIPDFFAYQDFLNQRIKDIEQVIDKYFQLLIPTILQTMKRGFERDKNKRKKENKEGTLKDQLAQRKYEEWYLKHSDDVQFHDPKYWPYTRKMKVIVEFDDELIQADKTRKDNRNGIQDICRMQGSLSQSYFIFDAQEFKVGRKIYFGIQQDEEINDDINDVLGVNDQGKGEEQDQEQEEEQSCDEQSVSNSSQESVRGDERLQMPIRSSNALNRSNVLSSRQSGSRRRVEGSVHRISPNN